MAMQLELLSTVNPWFVVGVVLLALAFAGFTLAVLTVASWGDSDSVEVDGEPVTRTVTRHHDGDKDREQESTA